eukprot:CAMPEP_0206366908 /NCGR_PEP_ID=MMETSP0294-20121207/3728_1 /ASSEMBLY_ACC=CAM_ASM_000327 /TAXON_ID=39354 /ORGANISM="Heterosigma akashiwo, Strain CCMP2393" /LENGTH=102 /DNA_ID=CAMNT_0053813055 /DNA_START=168 /DNA_END=472 /DNA_ORIENTATION=+
MFNFQLLGTLASHQPSLTLRLRDAFLGRPAAHGAGARREQVGPQAELVEAEPAAAAPQPHRLPLGVHLSLRGQQVQADRALIVRRARDHNLLHQILVVLEPR